MKKKLVIPLTLRYSAQKAAIICCAGEALSACIVTLAPPRRASCKVAGGCAGAVAAESSLNGTARITVNCCCEPACSRRTR